MRAAGAGREFCTLALQLSRSAPSSFDQAPLAPAHIGRPFEPPLSPLAAVLASQEELELRALILVEHTNPTRNRSELLVWKRVLALRKFFQHAPY
jgi:hypothetical protein